MIFCIMVLSILHVKMAIDQGIFLVIIGHIVIFLGGNVELIRIKSRDVKLELLGFLYEMCYTKKEQVYSKCKVTGHDKITASSE